MDKRSMSEKYTEIGMELIRTEEALADIANSQVTIIYLSSEHKKTSNGKVIHAECEKVSEKYKWGIPCDFTITVFEPNVEGMTDEQLARITEPFYRTDKSRNRLEGGTGLGLALCARIAEAHGADLRFESKIGEGTVAYISFPIKKS